MPPVALGRGVVVNSGDPVPEPWAGAPEVLVDDDALADPAGVVAVLHQAWAGRTAVVVRLGVDPARFREAPDIEVAEPWRLDPGFELWHDRLHFLVWANTYDARDGEPVWWWGRKAQRLGAAPPRSDDIHAAVAADVVLPDGTPAWIDGGPRGDVGSRQVGGVAVVHAESVDRGQLTLVPPPDGGTGDRQLAPDQSQAVNHGAGPARVIAPAGSGKTRVLTERLRHLVVARGYEPEGVVAVAYNRKARDEMAARTPGLGARILTLNALGYELVAAGLGRRPEVIDAREVRRLLEPLVPRGARRLNTDPLATYLDALSAVRLGLRDPVDVEDESGDVPGLAEAFPAYRAELRRRGVVDFDEQVLLAVELLLGDGGFRRAQQSRHRHLLVDEFQDLTPAHVLLLRLLSAPHFDVFGVGDDDQVIYGHAGASPRFLTEFGRYFPAAAEHALEVNYRCPPAVVDAARHLLTRNRVRVTKRIRAGRTDSAVVDGAAGPDGFGVRRHVPQAGATELVDVVLAWLTGDAAAQPRDIAVLTRVGSLLLAPHVALVEAGVPTASILRPDALTRTGLRAALAYLRIAVDAERIDPRDLIEVYRRPSRGLPNWIERWFARCRSVDDVQRAAGRIDDVKVAGKVDGFAGDLAKLATLAGSGSTRGVLEHVRDTVGLGQAADLLDATGVAGESHRDDLEALLQVADLHPDPGGFEPWLRAALARPGDHDGVVLSTIHRVKGREWRRVVVFGANDGIMPHRLSHGRAALEEERRVFHVAITRAIDEVTVLADESRPAPFLAELDEDATPAELEAEPAPDEPPAPARQRADLPGHQPDPTDPEAACVEAALREWRRERSRADGVPAFVVIHDRHLLAIAERRPTDRGALAACPGIGPAKLAAYGDELVSLVRGICGEPRAPGPSDSSSDN
ncbi:MAG TPA: ATP-dependent DNA helicase UvrD2 [Acidimicrobiales bacterium]